MIAIGSDHGGFELKKAVMQYLDGKQIAYKDMGTYTQESTDYPVYGKKVVNSILKKECDKGIIICGTGIGISIMANRYKGIRAALCSDCFSAEATRLHNDANVLAMGGRVLGEGLALKIVATFLETPFSGEERHTKRINMLEND